MADYQFPSFSANEVPFKMPAPACEEPVLIRANRVGGDSKRMVPCGKCYFCRRKLVRRWQGLGLIEQKFPYYDFHRDPRNQHFFTLTYAETPLTVVRPNEYGYFWDSTGQRQPWSGPFYQGKRKRIRRDEKGVPFYDRSDPDYDPRPHGVRKAHGEVIKKLPPVGPDREYLTDEDFAYEHRQYLQHHCGWTPQQMDDWISGNYKPAETLRYRDVQLFLKRLRRLWAKKNEHETDEGRKRLRYLVSGEYGDAKTRPHFHIIIWGLPLEHATMVHDCWEGREGDRTGLNGHVFPSREATLSGETVMRDRAAVYQAKDLVKRRHEFIGSPNLMGIEVPKILASQKPPIGEGGYMYWFQNWIAPMVEKAERMAREAGYAEPDVDRYVIQTLRKNYGQLHVPVGDGKETFPVMESWKLRVREDLDIDVLLWDDVTVMQQHFDVACSQAVEENIDGLGEEHEQHRRNRKEKSRRILRDQKARIDAKRRRLHAAGLL